MNLFQAMKALIEGKKIRDPEWQKYKYIRFKNEDLVVVDSTGTYKYLGKLNSLCDWEEYKEPELVFEEFVKEFTFLWDDLNLNREYEVMYADDNVILYKECGMKPFTKNYAIIYKEDFSRYVKHMKRV